MKIKILAVLIIFLAAFMQACAHQAEKRLISVPENAPVKIIHQDSQTGIIIQYSIEKVEIDDGRVTIHLLEPGKLHSVDKDIANLYFKVEMRNPTGENLVIYTVVNKGERRTVQMNISGNIPASQEAVSCNCGTIFLSVS